MVDAVSLTQGCHGQVKRPQWDGSLNLRGAGFEEGWLAAGIAGSVCSGSMLGDTIPMGI
jgi:hypothetical protein